MYKLFMYSVCFKIYALTPVPVIVLICLFCQASNQGWFSELADFLVFQEKSLQHKHSRAGKQKLPGTF